jgi:hypothetical protein
MRNKGGFMTQAIKKEGERLYTVFSFVGCIHKYRGKTTLEYIPLKEYLTNKCYDYTVKDIFSYRGLGLYFESREMSISDIRDNVSRGFVVVSITKTMKLMEVKSYVDAGFRVLFMRYKDYNAMRKEY